MTDDDPPEVSEQDAFVEQLRDGGTYHASVAGRSLGSFADEPAAWEAVRVHCAPHYFPSCWFVGERGDYFPRPFPTAPELPAVLENHDSATDEWTAPTFDEDSIP